MGEIAEMMLDGTLCEGCGVFMGEACEFPRLCSSCAKERRSAGATLRKTGLGGYQDVTPHRASVKQPTKKVACPECGRKVKAAGLADHMRDMHRGTNQSTREQSAT